jgi:hypothetical protein
MFSVKSFYYLVFILFCYEHLSAQKDICTQDDLLNKIGSWKKNGDYLSPGKNYTEAIKPEIFKRLDKIQKIVQEAYPHPKGMEVRWKHEVYGTPPYKSGTVCYSLWAQLFEYGCDVRTHNPVLYDESDDDVYVFLNHFDRFFLYDTSMRLGNLYVALMYPRVGKMKDVDLFQVSLVRGDERFIIISRDGQLPYTALTEKQYLLALKRKLQNEESSILDRSLKNAKTDEQKSNAEKYWTSRYDPKIKRVDDYLMKASEEELNQVAFVKDMIDFKNFTTEKDGGRMPVILNSSYFNPKQPAFLPQFMVVYWMWNDGEGPGGGLLKPVPPDMNVCCRVSKYFKESIEQNLDLNALKQMLDK